jgi:hypothetical protein
MTTDMKISGGGGRRGIAPPFLNSVSGELHCNAYLHLGPETHPLVTMDTNVGGPHDRLHSVGKQSFGSARNPSTLRPFITYTELHRL